MLQLLFPFPHDRIDCDLVSWELELLWDAVKGVAIGQLQGSLADGPRVLRGAVVFLGPWDVPELVAVEEIVLP